MSSLPPGTDLCAIPAAEPPPGQTSNFVNPPNLATETIAVTTVTLTWATLFTAARLYTNFRKLTWADGFVLIALVLSATYNALVLDSQFLVYEICRLIRLMIRLVLKYTRHQWDIPACWFTARYMKAWQSLLLALRVLTMRLSRYSTHKAPSLGPSSFLRNPPFSYSVDRSSPSRNR